MTILPKCKGEGHVQCVPYAEASHAFGPGETQVQYVAEMKCRVEGTSGPGIIIGSPGQLNAHRGMHIQLALAKQMPVMLRNAAAVAEDQGDDVAIEHTVKGPENFQPWRVLTALGAFDLATRIAAALPK